VAHGTFYTYFHDKDDIFAAVVRTIDDDFHEPAPRPAGETLYEAIHHANCRYYETYAGRGRMMGILEQVATFDDDVRSLRRDVRRRFVERSERAIRRWQDAGLADPTVDPHYAASALGSMVDRSVYLWLVLGEPHDKDIALDTLSRLWVNALQLPPDHPARLTESPRL